MISHNLVTVCGKCTYHKLWPANGRPYTSMWIRLKVPGINAETFDLLCQVSVGEKQINSNMLKAIESKLDAKDLNTHVLISGKIGSKKTKDGGTVSIFQASLSSVEVIDEDCAPCNDAFIVGEIEQRIPGGLTIGVSYHNPKDNSWKKRMIPIVIPAQGAPGFDLLHINAVEKIRTCKRVAIFGYIKPKAPNGADMANIYATRIIPIG